MTKLHTKKEIEKAVDDVAVYYKSMFLEYWNDYLTLKNFAIDKGLTLEKAEQVVRIGRKMHNADAERLKTN